MISPAAVSKLATELKSFEQSDSTQIVILTIPSLEGEVIDEFGIKVAESWKIGQRGKSNGVIFIVSRDDRKIRIEVGRGLEGSLTDLMAGRIVDLVVKPRFKRGDFDGGFAAGVSALIDATRGEFKATETDHRTVRHERSSKLLSLLIFGGVVVLILGSISRVLGAVAGAVGLPAAVLLSSALSGVAIIAVLAIVGLLIGLFLPVLFSSGRGGFGPGGGYFGGFGGGGFGGGGFGGGGDGGGFSGGGGDFGGGGASGDW